MYLFKYIIYNQIMKMIPLFFILLLAGCATNLQYASDSTSNKNWLEIVSSKKDFEGKMYDACYKFNLSFWPQAAAARLKNAHNCTEQCCWKSERDEVEINFNEGLEDELAKYGRAYKYTPEKVKIKVKYASVLDLMNATATPGVIDRNGYIKLKYVEVTDSPRLKEVNAASKLAAEQAAQKEAQFKERLAALEAREQAESDQLTSDYNKRLSVNYTRRFYGYKIDRYLAGLDEAQRAKGLILLFDNREWKSVKEPSGTHAVSCYAPGRLGKTQSSLKSVTIECGLWQADLNEQTVKPYDSLARQIAEIK